MRGTRGALPLGCAPTRFIPAHAGNTHANKSPVSVSTVHPRACGEHNRSCERYWWLSGSSPRMRGTQLSRIDNHIEARFIPAHAGNTARPWPCRCPPTVHPRACGEHLPPRSLAHHPRGSSPRMRGTRQRGRDIRALEIDPRFIPAHAGNTHTKNRSTVTDTVHPRACGEHRGGGRRRARRGGSSPRMRGTLRHRFLNVFSWRFIPAHAGNTNPVASAALAAAVHPRACGEHSWPAHPHSYGVGSSPRMRGTHRFGAAKMAVLTVHPRACGEHSNPIFRCRSLVGSSPRMRGTRCWRRRVHYWLRFIPAHAGNTSMPCVSLSVKSVHPRACGEHFCAGVLSLRDDGSSPRMRGTLLRLHEANPNIRFIPAHAGNTQSGQNRYKCPFGSSPRMRGTRLRKRNEEAHRRFIPAHAGNTQVFLAERGVQTVHPRACGEHFLNVVATGVATGSSPRMRGTRRPRQSKADRTSVHPRACGEHSWPARPHSCGVGSSPRMRGTRRILPPRRFHEPVHPRACGEHAAAATSIPPNDGSSPRMRGTLQSQRPGRTNRRFIPAHAGNTLPIYV